MPEIEQKEIIATLELNSDTDSNSVNARSAAAILAAIDTVIKEAATGMERNRELVVKARPFTRGSFEINIEVLIVGTAMATQLSPVTIFKIIQTLKEFFNVKNLLKGEVPVIEKNIIKNCNNYEISNSTIILLDRESESNRFISNAMSEIQNDKAIKALNIVDSSNRESIVTVKREEFSYYKIYDKESIEIEEQEIETYDDQRLRIVSPVFDIADRRDWLFNWINNNDFCQYPFF